MKLINHSLRYSASDLINYLGCRHLTELDRKSAMGEIGQPGWVNPSLALIQQKGLEHERAYVGHLKSLGLKVCELDGQFSPVTTGLLREGYDVITQARFERDGWVGIADILRKVPGKSSLGDFFYEVEDTKLARETKAGTVIQLCLYSEMLGELQDRIPDYMSVVKPGSGFITERFRYQEFDAYYRTIKRRFMEWMAAGPHETSPLPVPKCDTCRWWMECNRKWHAEDHLSLVAGIRTGQIRELETQGIPTLETYALEEKPFRSRPGQGSEETYHKIHRQARVQLDGRVAGKMLYDLLPFEPLRGLNRLPEPSPGDIYFDIEGDHFYEDGGIEYLFGACYREAGRGMVYRSFWAKDRQEEKKAFGSFVRFVMDRWNEYPGMHIYHYAPYEPSAVKRLASRHAIHEQEVDRLLRSMRFVDLYSVIRETMMASVESYSLKDVERLAGFARKADLRLAGDARRRMSIAFDFDDFSSLAGPDYELIETYNQDDCLATAVLHDFTESVYREQLAAGSGLTRPVESAGDAPDHVAEEEERARILFEKLVNDLPGDPSEWTDEERAKWLLAHQVDYYRREMRSAWWEYYRLHEMEPGDLLEERKGIAGLRFVCEVPAKGKTPVHRYSFPAQEISMEEGNELCEPLGEKIGSIHAFSLENRTVDIKKTGKTSGIHPYAVFIREIVQPGVLIPSLLSFVGSVVQDGIDGDGAYRAGRDLLLKKPPRMSAGVGFGIREEENTEAAALRNVLALENGILPVQGPPGTGKTYLGAGLIAELVKRGKRVGVTAVSHKVIQNLLDKAAERGREKGIEVRIRHKGKQGAELSKPDPVFVEKKEDALFALKLGCVVGGTAWLWADNLFEGQLDYLFVDEAGQMSLTHVLTVSRAAGNLVLLGDPRQLEQPRKGAHPEGADISALEHILDGRQTMPPEKGLFLGTTWRLHPLITRFTSTLYYEGRLSSRSGLENQRLVGNTPFSGSGLFYVAVDHFGNQSQSPEEASAIMKMVRHLLNSGISWIDSEGLSHELRAKDILVVAPYNAQVSLLRQSIPGIAIGTVDKFQGQEAPVVIYSMTSSSPEDAPRGMSFLYNPNRMNVATSRARCACILVSSPRLFEVDCNTIDQMKWANAFCYYSELARPVDPHAFIEGG